MVDKIIEKYPNIVDMMKKHDWRKYELQDILGVTRFEVNEIIDVMTEADLIEERSKGWGWKRNEVKEM